jgi:hypothetical protein
MDPDFASILKYTGGSIGGVSALLGYLYVIWRKSHQLAQQKQTALDDIAEQQAAMIEQQALMADQVAEMYEHHIREQIRKEVLDEQELKELRRKLRNTRTSTLRRPKDSKGDSHGD